MAATKEKGTETASGPKDRPVLTSAPPPWHSVVTIVLFIGISLYALPSWENVDQVATVETFTKRVFPHLISLKQLAYFRLLLATAIWSVTIHMVFLSEGWIQHLTYLKSSKLHMMPNQMKGYKTMLPFTSLSWNLLGLSFALSGYIAWAQSRQDEPIDISPLVLRTALFAWEMAAPFTFIVAAVIRYAIWPLILSKKRETTGLKSVRNIFMHNLNVVFALTEVALLGDLPVRWSEIYLGTLFGCCYIVFSWCMCCRWNKDVDKYGPQFIYFFFDTTLPGHQPTLFIVALLFVFSLFYAFFSSTELFLEAVVPYGVTAHILTVAAISSVLMRFRD